MKPPHLFRLAQEASPIGSVLFRIVRDEQGAVVDFEWIHQNLAATAINGLPAGDACAGTRLFVRFPQMRALPSGQAFARVAATGVTWRGEVRPQDGRSIWLRLTALRPDPDVLAAFFEDVTDAREQRARVETLIAEAPMPISLFRGPELRHEIANAAYRALFHGRDLVGRTLREALPELESQGIVTICEQVYATGTAYTAKESPVAIRAEDGTLEERFFDFVVQPLHGTDGRIDGILAFGNEVSAQVRARRAAEDASRTKDEFLAMLGHELRNPLAPITTALHLMRLRGGAENAREREIIERQVDHLVRLVDDLLDVSRITRGKLDMRRERVEMSAVVAKAIETASPLLEQRKHHLAVSVAREGLAVIGDATRLAQVVANLLTNAAKYTEPGGHVEVTCEREGDTIALRVRDDGIGITHEMLPRIFELFTQGPQALDRGQGGLGLGLAIVHSLARMHGGTVTVHSDGAERGSEFTVRLPAAPPVDRPASAPPPGSVAPSTPAGAAVLIVDDNEDSAELLAEAVRMMGYAPRVAFDGPTALRMIEADPPAIALLDIGLPVMDGYDVARRLRALPGGAGVRLVAITGYGQERDVEAARKAGFDAHLVKPVDLARLESALAKLRP